MGFLKRFGKTYRDSKSAAIPEQLCEVCGAEMELDPESGERHCPLCESEEP